MPKIGAHVSSAGGLEKSFDKALEIGAECTQIFISPPQQWLEKTHPQEEIDRYTKKAAETQIGPNFIHATYLTNLASANPDFVRKAISWLVYSQKTAEKLRIAGTIFHIGSAKEKTTQEAVQQVISNIQQILSQTGQVNLILETSAGAGNTVGDSLEELEQIISAINDPRLKICLDTQHMFASGYGLTTPGAVAKVAQQIEQTITFTKIIAVHANDSKVELNSHKDRHENIGQGLIGLAGFRALINHPQFAQIPFILEVPGMGNQGPDKVNVDLLKSLRTN
ncbi:deoxyribonuclease IV [Patescibacteria group bacterium]|nr:deoxyribonuclease IV [Patescibacteria group bacterium]